jgi:hypothetical protein
MDTLIEKASDIIRAASASQLALYAFCILVTAVLVFILFRAAPLAVQSGAFLITMVLMAAILVLASPRPNISQTPPDTSVAAAKEKQPAFSTAWTHKSFPDGNQAASFLSLERQQPNPNDVYATLYGSSFHVWWKPASSGYKYRYLFVPWDPKKPENVALPSPTANQIPIGFGKSKDKVVFLYFDASRG